MAEVRDDDVIATWPAQRWKALDTVAGVAILAVLVLLLLFTAALLMRAVLNADWPAALVTAVFVGALGWSVVIGVRSQAAKAELRMSGIVVRTFFRQRRISWPEIVRTEVEPNIDFPTLQRRGPMIILHLVGGSSVRLWATESWKFGADRRMDELNRQAEMIRTAHRAFDERTRAAREAR